MKPLPLSDRPDRANPLLCNLIPRFYDVTLGKIKVDGVDVRDYRLKSLRQKIGFIPQKALLFTGTIAENIRYGKEDASHKDLHQAADVAQAKDFIESREEGFATHLAEGGSNLFRRTETTSLNCPSGYKEY